MSNYKKLTQHPNSGELEYAQWLDDYYGGHQYGVHFRSTGEVFRASDFDWAEDPATLAMIPKRTADVMTVTHMDGKTIHNTEHPDGRKDVKVEVSSLDVDMTDPANAEAKKVIEEDILPAIADKEIICTLIHKPTNDHFTFKTKRKNLAANANVAMKKHGLNINGLSPMVKNYCLVEHDLEAQEVKVTSL